MENCEFHSEFKSEKFCLDPHCLTFLCPECLKTHDSSHKIIDYLQLMQEIRQEKEKQTIKNIDGITSRKLLLKDLDNYLQKITTRQQKLHEESQKIESELPKILSGIKNMLLVQRQQISEKIQEFAQQINDSRENLITELQDLQINIDLSQGKASAVRQFFKKILQEHSQEFSQKSELESLKVKQNEIENLCSKFNAFSPYDFFDGLNTLFGQYFDIDNTKITIENNMKIWNDTSVLLASFRTKTDSFLHDENSILYQTLNTTKKQQEICTELENILKKYSTQPIYDKSIDNLLQNIDGLCAKASYSKNSTPITKKPQISSFVNEKQKQEKTRGRTVLLPRKKEVKTPATAEEAPYQSVQTTSRIKQPTEFKDDKMPSPIQKSFTRVNSKKETLAPSQGVNSAFKRKQSVPRTEKSVERPKSSQSNYAHTRSKSTIRKPLPAAANHKNVGKVNVNQNYAKISTFCKEIKWAVQNLNENCKFQLESYKSIFPKKN